MTEIYIGRIVNTHGIKGELRIKDDLTSSQKEVAFKVGSNLIIDDKAYLITSYRIHKDYDMVTFKGFTNINDVLFLKGKKVYKEKTELTLSPDDILDSELETYKVKTITGEEGKILAIEKTGHNYKILRLLLDTKEVLVPYHKDFIVNLDQNLKEVTLKLP